MSKGMPSMVALLGLLAVAGYQNRDKIAQVLGGLKAPSGGAGSAPGVGVGDMLADLGGLFGGGGSGARSNTLTSGLADLLNSFKSAGVGDVADSWIRPGVPTQGLTPEQVERAVGRDNLAELSPRTGLSHSDLLRRLATAIPSAVDELTPEGRMPDEDEARALLLTRG